MLVGGKSEGGTHSAPPQRMGDVDQEGHALRKHRVRFTQDTHPRLV